MRVLALISLALLPACSQQEPTGMPRRPLRGVLALPETSLFVNYPTFDQRIARLPLPTNRTTVKPDALLFPDLWEPDARAVRDFVAADRRLFVLLSHRYRADDPRLFIVSTENPAEIEVLALPPAADNLAWTRDGQLLVGHVTATSGPPGQLSVVDPRVPRLIHTIALDGACISIAAGSSHAFAIERLSRGDGTNAAPLVSYSLVHLELARGVQRRLPLPAGARQVIVGPSGLLYVSHSSGAGVHATDGTIAVIDPRDWKIVDRLDLQMIVRRMVATSSHLLLNMLSGNGATSFGALRADHSTAFDLELSAAAGPQMVAVGDTAYMLARDGKGLIRIDVAKRVITRLGIPIAAAPKDHPGTIRVAGVRLAGLDDAP